MHIQQLVRERGFKADRQGLLIIIAQHQFGHFIGH